MTFGLINHSGQAWILIFFAPCLGLFSGYYGMKGMVEKKKGVGGGGGGRGRGEGVVL